MELSQKNIKGTISLI